MWHDVIALRKKDKSYSCADLKKQPILNIVYYTSVHDWLKCAWAIQSVKNYAGSHPIKIWIRFDDKTSVPEDILKAAKSYTGNPAQIGSHRRYGGIGVQACYRQLKDLFEISEKINQNDWLAKTDSDAFFISPKIFNRINSSNAGGCGMLIRRENCSFFTGAFFAYRASVIQSIWKNPVFDTILHASKLRKVPWHCLAEDVFMTCAAKKLKVNLDNWALGDGFPLLDVNKEGMNIDKAELLHFPGNNPVWRNYCDLISPAPSEAEFPLKTNVKKCTQSNE